MRSVRKFFEATTETIATMVSTKSCLLSMRFATSLEIKCCNKESRWSVIVLTLTMKRSMALRA